MIYIANGGYRTGSTFVFAVMKAVYDQNEKIYSKGVLTHDDILKLDPNEDWLIKSHNWLPPLDTGIRSIYSRRYFLDVYSSLEKVRPHSPMIIQDSLTEILEEKRREKYMLRLNPAQCLTLEYRDMFNDEIWAVQKIAAYLEMSVDPLPIIEKWGSQAAYDFTRNLPINNTTAYTRNHISDTPYPGNFILNLTTQEIKEVVKQYNEL